MREEEPVRESAEYTNKNMNVQMYYDSKLNKSFNQLCLSYVITVCDLKCIAWSSLNIVYKQLSWWEAFKICILKIAKHFIVRYWQIMLSS